jgi:hypothetical protein
MRNALDSGNLAYFRGTMAQPIGHLHQESRTVSQRNSDVWPVTPIACVS